MLCMRIIIIIVIIHLPCPLTWTPREQRSLELFGVPIMLAQ
jgi:hypothetical protein